MLYVKKGLNYFVNITVFLAENKEIIIGIGKIFVD